MTGDATGINAANAVLGVGMAHRGRSQSVLGRHWSPSGLVGAVGRASVGFGLAVGRSRSIRPTVRFDDLNSAALRPSFDLWRRHRADEAPDDAVRDEARPAEASIGDRTSAPARSLVATPMRGTAAAPTSPGGSSDRARRHPHRRARPTWTDQIIQRSSIGFVASAPGSSVPESAIPSDFVPTGDPKLDQLRLLVRRRSAASPSSPSSPSDRVGRVERGDDRSSPLRVEEPALRRTTAAEPTVSAGAVGPGSLARALRPESATAPSVPPARLGGPPAPTGPNTGAGRSTPAPRALPAGRAARGARRAPEPTRLDQLRSLLVSKGILDGGTDTDRGAPTSDPGRETPAETRAPGGADRPARPRPTTTAADLQRAVSRPGRGSPSQLRASEVAPSTPTTAPMASSSGQPPASGSPASGRSGDPTASGSLPLSPSPGRTDVGAPRAERDAGTRAVALAERTTEASPTVSGAFSPSLPISSHPAHQVRAQRLLRSGLVSDTGPGTAFARGELAVQRAGVDLGAEAVPTTSTVDVIEARPMPTEASPTRQRLGADTPSLARVDSPPDTVLRRVTLPRAFSSTHRPVASRPGATAVREVPGTSGTSQQASTVSLEEAATARRSAAPATLPQDGTARAAAATTPTAAGALLQVVRRLSAADASDPSSDEPSVLGGDRPAAESPIGRREPREGRASIAAAATTPTAAGALLQVVRRLSAADASDPSSDEPSVPGGDRPAVESPIDRREPREARASKLAPLVSRHRSSGDIDRVAGIPGAFTSTPMANDGGATTSTVADVGVAAGVAGAAEAGSGRHPGRERQRPAERVAEQFMTALSETVRRRPAPLPTTYRPLADAITGPRPVMLSTDAASRKALRSVGKVAATTGDTIHLDRQAVSASRLDEVMAHELTHIAHPSPVPRFFDDIDDSPEERRAEQVAKVMARSPLAPSATTSAPPARRRRDEATIRRSPASAQPPTARGSSAGTVSAQELAASLTRPSAARTSNVVQRRDTASSSHHHHHHHRVGERRSVRIGRRRPPAPPPPRRRSRNRRSRPVRGRRPSGSVSSSTRTSTAWSGCSKTG